MRWPRIADTEPTELRRQTMTDLLPLLLYEECVFAHRSQTTHTRPHFTVREPVRASVCVCVRSRMRISISNDLDFFLSEIVLEGKTNICAEYRLQTMNSIVCKKAKPLSRCVIATSAE